MLLGLFPAVRAGRMLRGSILSTGCHLVVTQGIFPLYARAVIHTGLELLPLQPLQFNQWGVFLNRVFLLGGGSLVGVWPQFSPWCTVLCRRALGVAPGLSGVSVGAAYVPPPLPQDIFALSGGGPWLQVSARQVPSPYTTTVAAVRRYSSSRPCSPGLVAPPLVGLRPQSAPLPGLGAWPSLVSSVGSPGVMGPRVVLSAGSTGMAVCTGALLQAMAADGVYLANRGQLSSSTLPLPSYTPPLLPPIPSPLSPPLPPRSSSSRLPDTTAVFALSKDIGGGEMLQDGGVRQEDG